VGTFWQDIWYDTLKIYEPELYEKMKSWTVDKHKEKSPGKTEKEVFDKNRKKAIKQFFDEIYSLPEDFVNAVEARAYAEALAFFKAFKSYGSAKYVR
jgi:fructose-bisphosphate aldolase class II